MKITSGVYGRFLQVLFITIIGCALLLALMPTLSRADEPEKDWTELSLEELEAMEVVMVTSVSKQAQKLTESPAAIYVITQEDIRRSGATSIPEALRMVPGLYVARIDSSRWSITSRGFFDEFSNKLLVLIDGRSVYSPLFAGVYWDVQDTLLEDIDRIEVIRGPGATLWGANAVNGIINIITKNAANSQGWLITAGAGDEERGFGGVRYGGKIGDDAHYRVYAKYFNRDDFVYANGDRAEDAWDMFRAGFRADWTITEQDAVTVQGDIYTGDKDNISTLPSLTPPYSVMTDEETDLGGADILARWAHAFSDESEMTLQLYYDRTERDSSMVAEDRDTVDVDFQHAFALGDRHAIIWGLGYRFMKYDTSPGDLYPSAFFVPDSDEDDLFSAFIQDEITLVPDRLRLTLGSKFEYNDYTGFEVQPSGRALWMPHDQHALWASVSRAVRTPSPVEHNLDLLYSIDPSGPLPVLQMIYGNDDFDSEELIAYELGYRVQPTKDLSVDIAAFYNEYDKLRTSEVGPPVVVFPFVVVSLPFDNKLEGSTYGVEIVADYQVTEYWQLVAAYSLLEMDLELDSDSTAGVTEEDDSGPQNQFQLRSMLNLPHNLEFDAALYYVDDVEKADISDYTRVDLRLGWRPTENLELSLVAQNVFDDHHEESSTTLLYSPASEIERSIYGQVTYKF